MLAMRGTHGVHLPGQQDTFGFARIFPETYPNREYFYMNITRQWSTERIKEPSSIKADRLLEDIRTERYGIESRSILFLGHSMGGLLIKQALINAHNNPRYTPIKDATRGLVFFATPHHGADGMLLSLGDVAFKIAESLDILKTLKSNSIFSDMMSEHWRHQLEQYCIVSFWGAYDNVSLPTHENLMPYLTFCHRSCLKRVQSSIYPAIERV